jgi:hypothetical protein
MHHPTLGVRARFAALLLVLVPALGMLAWTGSQGLTSSRQLTDTLFNDIIVTQHASAAMVAAMDKVHATAIEAVAIRETDRARSQTLSARLANDLIPTADAALAEVQRLHAGDQADERRTIADLDARWVSVRSIWNSIVVAPSPADVDIARIDAGLTQLDRVAGALVARETTDGRAEYVD